MRGHYPVCIDFHSKCSCCQPPGLLLLSGALVVDSTANKHTAMSKNVGQARFFQGEGTLTVRERIRQAIKLSAGNVILRGEVAGMGSTSRVSAALKALQVEGMLIRIGKGVYAKTRKSSVTGSDIPAGSLETLATELLIKLGVSVSAGSAANAYNSGETTQLPGAFVVNTGRRRISRKIEVGGRRLVYENDVDR